MATPVDAGTIYSDVRINLATLSGDIAKLDVKMNAIRKGQASTAVATQKGWTNAFGKIKIAGVVALAAITLAFKSAIQVTAQFEQSLANVGSVAGATAGEMRDLEEAAQVAGETTRFKATQAADAMYALASAGLTATQVVAALNGVLLLAGATNSDLSNASETVAVTLKQFNLEASKSIDITNVFAAAIGGSLANLDRLKTGMAQVGGVASSLDFTLEETTAMLEALNDAGQLGQKAGRELKSILLDLSDSGSVVVKGLEDMGISYDDLNPKTNDMATIIDNLVNSEKDLTDISSVFGKVAAPAMIAMLKAGGDKLREYEKDITGTNAATKMYSEQNDTLAGSFDMLKSKIEAAAIKITKSFTPVLRPLVDLTAKLVENISKLPDGLKVFFTVLLGGTGVVIGAATAWTFLAGAIGAVAGGLATVFLPITAAIAGVAALGGAMTTVSKIRETKLIEDFGELADEIEVSAENLKTATFWIKKLDDVKAFAQLIEGAGLSKVAIINLMKELDKASRLDMLKFDDGDVSHLRETISGLADEYGTTQKEMLMFFKLSGKVTNQAAIDLINYDLSRMEVGKERAEQHKKDIAAAVALEEQKIADLKKLDDEETATSNLNKKMKEDALNKYNASLANTDKMVHFGIITEKEANTERLNANKALVDSLLEVDTKYVSTTGQIIVAADKVKKLSSAILSEEEAEKARVAELNEVISATASVNGLTKTYTEKTEDLGQSTFELLQLERERTRAMIQSSKATDSAKEASITAMDAYFDAFESQNYQEIIDGYNKKIEEIGLTTTELRDLEHSRAIQKAKDSGEEQGDITNLITKIDEYYKKLEDNETIDEKKTLTTQEYIDKLEKVGLSTTELSELERKAAIAALVIAKNKIGATEEEIAAIDANIDAINAYYDKLSDNAAAKKFKDNMFRAGGEVAGIFGDLSSIFSSIGDEKIASIDKELQATLKAQGLEEESAVEKLEKELADIKKVDNKDAKAIDDKIARAKAANNTEAVLILQAEKAKLLSDRAEVQSTKQKEIDKAKIVAEFEKKKAAIKYKYEMIAYRASILQATASAALALAKTYETYGWTPWGIAAGVAQGVASTAQIASVVAAKPVAPALATGGVILPSAGGTLTRQAENGYGEVDFNAGPSGEALLNSFASKIASQISSSDSKNIMLQLYMNRELISEGVAEDISNGKVRIDLQ